MKKHIPTAAIIAAAIIIFIHALTPAKASSEQAAHWQEMQTDMIKLYDGHIESLQKRYDCAKAATSDETLAACNRTNYPETGCP